MQAPAVVFGRPAVRGPIGDERRPADGETPALGGAAREGPTAASEAAGAGGSAEDRAPIPVDWTAAASASPLAAARVLAAAALALLGSAAAAWVQQARALDEHVSWCLLVESVAFAFTSAAIWAWFVHSGLPTLMHVGVVTLLTLAFVRLAVAGIVVLSQGRRSSWGLIALYFGRAALPALFVASCAVAAGLMFYTACFLHARKDVVMKGEGTPEELNHFVALPLLWEFVSLARAWRFLFEFDTGPPKEPPPLPAEQSFESVGERERDMCPQCAICLSTFEDADTVVVLPCSHTFHHRVCVIGPLPL